MAAQKLAMAEASTISADGFSDKFKVSTASMMALGLNITAVTGSPAFFCWLQGSNDDGATWFDVPHDYQLTAAAAGADATALAGKRNITGASGVSATGKHAAIYKHLPYDYVRLAYVGTWSTADVTITAQAVVK